MATTPELRMRAWDRRYRQWVYFSVVFAQRRFQLAYADGAGEGDLDLDPETFGQATGLHDQDNREIFEEDILIEFGEDGYTLNEVTFGENDDQYGWFVDYIQAFTPDHQPVDGRFSRGSLLGTEKIAR
jgi:hypothetical protein